MALLERYAFVVIWATLPFTAGPSLANALDPIDDVIRSTASVGLWAAWAATLAASLVPRTVTLTHIRIVAPASLAVSTWAAISNNDHRGAWDAVAIIVTFVATIAALIPTTTDVFVNGSSYGDERRLALRPPGPLLIGPIELTWLAVVVGAVTGPLLLAARSWIIGVAVLVVGWVIAALGVRSLHVLAQRWIVFVPAGVVVVDRFTLTDTLMVPRASISALRPAPADTDARDLTAGAVGLALQLDFTEEMGIVPAPRRSLRNTRPSSGIEPVMSVLVSPSRPGTVLSEAKKRRLAVKP